MSTAQPVAWEPPLCRRTRIHYSRRFPISRSTSVGSFPGRPSPCPHHYSAAFDYYAASALCPARWHFRAPVGLSSVRVPQFQRARCERPVAACFTPDGLWSNSHRSYQSMGLPSFPFGRGVSAISPPGTYDASDAGSFRQRGSQG